MIIFDGAAYILSSLGFVVYGVLYSYFCQSDFSKAYKISFDILEFPLTTTSEEST